MTAGAADPTMAELNELIAEKRIELQVCEDWHSKPGWETRAEAIRQEIRELERDRDLLPQQRQP